MSPDILLFAARGDTMARRKASATVQLKVRMKEPLRAQLEKAAKQRGISINSEIVDRLEQSQAMSDVLTWLFQGEVTPAEIVSLQEWWQTLRGITGEIVGDTDANAWRSYSAQALDAAIPAIRAAIEDQFIRRVHDDVVANGPPGGAEFYPAQKEGPSQAIINAERRRYVEHALRVLQRRAELADDAAFWENLKRRADEWRRADDLEDQP
jgi:hypothetical protein